jgi:hypothetical protein
MARRKRDVSDLPYAAPPLSCAAFNSETASFLEKIKKKPNQSSLSYRLILVIINPAVTSGLSQNGCAAQ